VRDRRRWMRRLFFRARDRRYVARGLGLFPTLAGYGYVGGVLDLRDDRDIGVSTMLWQLPRVRSGLGTRHGSLLAGSATSSTELGSESRWVYSSPDG
jgi:hypothetical protein